MKDLLLLIDNHRGKIFTILIFVTLLITCLTYLFLHTFKSNEDINGSFSSLPFTENCESWTSNFDPREEEERIFKSVQLEHLELLEKHKEATLRLNAINKAIPAKEAELKELEFRLQELRLLQREFNDRRNVQLRLPDPPLFPPPKSANFEAASKKNDLVFESLEDCIDFSRCSISTLFRVFIYLLKSQTSPEANGFYSELLASQYVTDDPQKACLFLAIYDGQIDVKKLAHWKEYGRNHVVFQLAGEISSLNDSAALMVSSQFKGARFRPKVDLAVYLNVPNYSADQWQRLPALLPLNRRYFLHFASRIEGITHLQQVNFDLLKNSMDLSQDSHLIDTNCTNPLINAERMGLCYDEAERLENQRYSTFTLLFPSPSFQQRFYEALLAGSVPVIIGTDDPLPFDDLIDWRLASIRILSSRFPELHYFLRAISTADLMEMRRKGRFFFENYLMNKRVLSRAILSSLRFRLQMPGDGAEEPEGLPLFYNQTYPAFLSTATRPPYDDEFLGPSEAPTGSPSYSHNITSLYMYAHKLWNEQPFAVEFAPRFLAFSPPLPSDAEFSEDTSFGMRPISPGSGHEFSMALGGNRPREQFTIVIVTYNRDSVLAATLERFNKLPYLNKIVVVWNSVDRIPTISWPRLHVPIVFLNGTRNSLNNRFVPYREIETEAVLSIDDDIDLKQHEIIFAFRVWREQREKIVGFPARYHARFDGETYYNSNHTCQLSMILTGAAFIHKAYFTAYTYHMPEVIRQKVDDWTNCEDIAMNFLVAHLTRKPPLKTTSKWTIRCPTCSENLSIDDSYYSERHECIRFLIRIYGYNPLLFSQYRADSVLFKTRVPANHSKCFNFV